MPERMDAANAALQAGEQFNRPEKRSGELPGLIVVMCMQGLDDH
jgi:hypothetical protein